MLFNSIEFAIFLVIVYVLYWFLLSGKLKLQNIFLLIASYVFYGWWDWRFLFLLALSTLIDYVFGLVVYNTSSDSKKKFFLWLSVANNLGVLGFFKYFNFFADSAQALGDSLGFHIQPYVLAIALPVGISFYTFHGMSYVFDIYRNKAVPTRNFVDYAVFVSFFPLLVAGPIERSTHLLPQVEKPRRFDYGQSVHGLRLIMWGLFKKIIIADSLAAVVNPIFNDYAHMSVLSLLVGIFSFALQIYGDFSGYSDIARGVAKLFGFELLINFRFPYFARDIAEFWRKWHISLTSWFKDYLYIPLGGSREGTFKSIRNTFIVFLVSGFWHGASWTFIFWGFLHALYFLPLLLTSKNRVNTGAVAEGRMLPQFKEGVRILWTFLLVCVAWVFFRAATIGEAFDYLGSLFSNKLLSGNEMAVFIKAYGYLALPLLILLVVEWFSRNADDVAGFFDQFRSRSLRYAVYFAIFFLIILYGTFEESSFIYFQF